MTAIATAIRREFRIAFSMRAQPVWFRVVKWAVFIPATVALYPTRWFWFWIIGVPTLGTLVHFIYRWQTRVWKRPWGGWDDLDAGRD